MQLIRIIKSIVLWSKARHISYSCTGEDLIIDSLFANKKGFYFDIGANDPIIYSNTYLLYKKGWHGYLVEPDIFKCGLLKWIRRKDQVINCGVGKESGKLNFFQFHPDMISTFSQSDAEAFQKLGHKLISIKEIPVISLKEMFERYAKNQPIDFINIDTEGWDLEIIKSNDWQKFRPKVVMVEVCHYRGSSPIRKIKEFDEVMIANNYVRFADTYINAIYVSIEYLKEKKLY